MYSLQIVILAAGVGSRMKSQFPGIPKGLIPVDHVPMIVRLLQSVIDSKMLVDRVVIIVRPDEKDMYAREIERYMSIKDVVFLTQGDDYGTAAAVQSVPEHFIAEWNMVLNVDAPLIEPSTFDKLAHKIRMDSDLLIGSVYLKDPSGYGRVVRDPFRIVEQSEIDELNDEHPWRCIKEVNTGIYVIRGDLFRRVNEIGRCPCTGEKKLTDLCLIARSPSFFSELSPQEIININTPLDRNYAEHILCKKRDDIFYRYIFTILRRDMTRP